MNRKLQHMSDYTDEDGVTSDDAASPRVQTKADNASQEQDDLMDDSGESPPPPRPLRNEASLDPTEDEDDDQGQNEDGDNGQTDVREAPSSER